MKIKLQISMRERPVLPVRPMPQIALDYFNLLEFVPVAVSSRARDLGRAHRRSAALRPIVEETPSRAGRFRAVVEFGKLVEQDHSLGAGRVGRCSQDF